MSVTPLKGDRSARDMGFPTLHASDIEDETFLYHKNPNESAPIMTLGTMEGALVLSSSPFRIYNQYGANRTIKKVFLSVNTAPVGDDIIVDVKVNGVSIFDTGNHPKILAGANTGESVTFLDDAWNSGDYLTWEVTQIGSTTPGSNLVVHIIS